MHDILVILVHSNVTVIGVWSKILERAETMSDVPTRRTCAWRIHKSCGKRGV